MRWYGKEFTVMDAAIILVLMLLCGPMHEFGHWATYWIFGIPAEFGIVFDPVIAFTVQPFVVPSFYIQMVVFFFGGGFVSIIAGIVAIKSRPSLMIMIFGLAGGITESSFLLFSRIYGIHFNLLVHSNVILYMMLQLVPMIVLFVTGFPE